MKSVFLLGTDTSSGKTHAAAALMLRYKKFIYWKAVQTGYPQDDDCRMVQKLTALSSERFFQTGFVFKEPLSPHRASELEGRILTVDEIHQKFKDLSDGKYLLVEGAGGLLVPINRSETWLEFLAISGMQIVIVSRTGLGTINHTLLTIHCLRENNIKPAGIIYCGERNDDNIKTIEQFSGIPSLGQFYFEEGMDFTAVSDGIDGSGILEKY